MKGRYLTLACGFLLLFVFSCFGQDPAETKPEMQPLQPGQTAEREIAPDQKHIFTVSLAAGQFARIDVIQTAGDLKVEVLALDNKNTLDVKNETPSGGTESTVVAVREAGEYRIQVSFEEKPKKAGRYSIKVSDLRAATEKEFAYTAGRRIASEVDTASDTDYSAAHARRAIERYTEAVELFRTAGDARLEGDALNHIGAFYSELGNRTKALEFQQQALAKFKEIGDRALQAVALNEIGRMHSMLGDRQKAIEVLNEAAAAAIDAKDKRNEGRAYNGIGSAYSRLGDPDRAEAHHQKALKLFEEIDDRMNQAVTSNYLGNASADRKDHRKSLEFYLKAIEIEKTIPGSQPNPSFRNNLGMAYFRLGETAKGIEAIEEALNISRARGDKPNEAAFMSRLGQANSLLKKYDIAVDWFRQSIDVYRTIEDPTRLAEALYNLAWTHEKAGSVVEAQANIEEAIRMLEDFRAYAASNDVRDLYSANSQRYFGLYIDLLMARHAKEPGQNFDALALQANERSRARGLLNLIAESNVNIREGIDPKLLERDAEARKLLTKRLEELTEGSRSKASVEKMAALKRGVEESRIAVDQMQARIRAASPRYASITKPKTLSLEEIQRDILDQDSVLLEYSTTGAKLFLWIATKTDLRSIELPDPKKVKQTARQFHEALTARNKQVKFETPEEREARIEQADKELERAGAELSRIVLAPAAPFVKDKRILVVADGGLEYVPFAALRLNDSAEAKGRYLIETNEVVNLPSASVLATIRKETAGRKPAPRTLAVLADPVFDAEDERFRSARLRTEPKMETVAFTKKPTRAFDDSPSGGFDLERLPFTRREADAITSVLPEGQREKLLDFAASRTSAMSPQLSSFRVVHFATHGLINDKSPELGGLALSMIDETGKSQNGFLRVADIYNLKLPAEMVVLSGCRTGLGKDIKGEGLVGLTRAFMYAGAKRVAVSLWDISDEATSDLMSHFYRDMFSGKKRSPAAALRQAQTAMISDKRWSHPYFWAAFVIQGESK